MNEIVVLGSLNADLVVTVDQAPAGGQTVTGESFSVVNGGKGANQAYAAAMMGGEVAMLGRVGDDDYGRRLVAGLEAAGVNVSKVRCIEEITTGVASITVEASGENRIVVIPGANGAFSREELERDKDVFSGAKVALFQLESPLETVEQGLALARENGCITILDPAPAQILERGLLEKVDYLTPNVSELALLSKRALGDKSSEADIVAAARSLLELGVGKVLAKLGERGAVLVDGNGAQRIDAVSVQAVDSTAAGDCFNGAFAAALSRGVDEVSAGRFACSAATLSVMRKGAQSSIPSLDEVLGR